MEKNIYLLKGGVSCNDIKNSLVDIVKNRSELNSLKKSISLNNKLTNNGIYELLLQGRNKKLGSLFENNTIIFTSLDDIETGLIFGSNYNVKYIYPILNLTEKKDFKKLRDVKDFKNFYGKNNDIFKYWESNFHHKKLNLNLINIKNNIPKISWKYYESKYLGDYKKFSMTKFLKFLKEIFNSNIQYKNIIFIGNNKFINNFLKKSKNQDFNIKKDIIEYSSLYEVTIKNNKNISVNSFNKIYPTKFNHYPLSLGNNNNFSYGYSNKSYNIVDSNYIIPKKILLKYNLIRCLSKEKIDKYKDMIKDKNNNVENFDKEINFEKIIKIINK